MSAYIVDKPHIDALANLALHGASDSVTWRRAYLRWAKNPLSEIVGGLREPRQVVPWHEEPGAYTPDQLGQLLVDANIASIRARYSYKPEDMLPDYTFLPYVWRKPARQLPSVAALKAINGYEYQACEVRGWPGTEAYDFCDSLRRELIHCLPGYEEADWRLRDEATAGGIG